MIKKITESTTVTTWLSFLTKALSFVVILPILLNRYEVAEVALWHLYLVVWSLQMVFDAGFGSAFTRIIAYGTVGVDNLNFVGKQQVSGEENPIFLNSVFQVMKKFYFILSLICLVVLAIVGTYFFRKPIELTNDLTIGWFTWFFFIITYPLLIWGNIYINFLQGNHYIPVLRLWETLFNLISIISVIVLMLLKVSIHWLVFTYQVWFVIGVVRNYLLNKQKLGYIFKSKSSSEISSKIKGSIMTNALKSGMGVLMAQGVTQGTSIFYAQFISPTLLAPYLIGLNIANSIKTFAYAPFHSKIPLMATFTGKGDAKQLRDVAKKNMKRFYMIFIGTFILITFGYEFILHIINSKVGFPNIEIWLLICFGILIERFGAMHLQVYSTTNHIIWHWLNGITGLGIMLFFWITLPYIGLYAFPIAYSFAYLCFYSWYAPMLSYRVLKTTFVEFESMSFIPYLFIFIIIVVISIIKNSYF